MQHWREAWADLANACLAENGHDVRIDHRSLAKRGLDLMPQVKLAPRCAGARSVTPQKRCWKRDAGAPCSMS
ncbi:MobA/MobL family protein [Acidibrevibacterium fodinaquatile]|uniref:MobA/MobL family protein n=1 Tax=Acidibrevibacterium fodinaquatile TaxID=1969806 RepID=UPI001F081EE0|nr:MobA/MobL family protein [Acidibrevibacterium fodinaquatile]